MATTQDLFWRLYKNGSAVATKSELLDAALRALTLAYDEHPPFGENGKPVKPLDLARMAKSQVDEKWDFQERHTAWEIATVLAIAAITKKRKSDANG